jgi:hypothetical protein
LTAYRLGYQDLALQVAAIAPDRPWQTRWAHGRRSIGRQVLYDHTDSVWAVAVGELPDGTPVIVSVDGAIASIGGLRAQVRVRRLVDGSPVGEPLTGVAGAFSVVEVGQLPDGTPVIVSGGDPYGRVRVWRLADGSPVGELTGHSGEVEAVAVGRLPDGTPVIVSGGADTVQVWRLVDGRALSPPLWLDGAVHGVAMHGTIIVSAVDGHIAAHQPVLLQPVH